MIYLLSLAGACQLDPVHNFNFFPSLRDELGMAQVVHFFGTHRFFRNVYPRAAARVVSQLCDLVEVTA